MGVIRDACEEKQTKEIAHVRRNGGFSLKDQWEKGEALKALHESKWDCVVLQDQSTLGINFYLEGKLHVTSDEAFRALAEKWSPDILSQSATPLYFLTWARKATPEDQAALNYAYVSAARKTGSRIVPVGLPGKWCATTTRPLTSTIWTDHTPPRPAAIWPLAPFVRPSFMSKKRTSAPDRPRQEWSFPGRQSLLSVSS